jgi:hypothetical protein
MHCSILKSNLALNIIIGLWKLLVFQYILGMSEIFCVFNACLYSKICNSARCSSAVNVLCKDVNIFGTVTVLIVFYNYTFLIT